MMSILSLLLGFPLLIKGADWLVDGAGALAKRFNVPDLVIGLTIVAFGTSAPELIVSVLSALRGNADIAMGNVVGSNIVNVLFILGLCAVVRPLRVTKGTVWKEIPMSLLAAVAMGLMAADQLIDGAASSAITRIDGLVLIGFFIIFLYYTLGLAKKDASDERPKHEQQKRLSVVIGLIIIGLIGLVAGGKFVVDGAVALATMLGVSSSLIGLTIVAVGTSLPELATSVVATYRGNDDIAVGNVVGSNIFNVFWILGVSAIISPLPTPEHGLFDIAVAALASLLLFVCMFFGRKHTLDRFQGTLFMLMYVAYVGFLIMRG